VESTSEKTYLPVDATVCICRDVSLQPSCMNQTEEA